MEENIICRSANYRIILMLFTLGLHMYVYISKITSKSHKSSKLTLPTP